MSVGAFRALSKTSLRTLGDLVECNETLLYFHGDKVVAELRDILEAYGLRFGMKPSDWSSEERDANASKLPGAEGANNEEATQAKLLLRVGELNLSTRASNVLLNIGAEFVGDIVVMTELELLKEKNCGRRSVTEILNKLRELDLQLGMQLSGWSQSNARKMRAALNVAKNPLLASMRTVQLPQARSLEEELQSIVRALVNDRNCEITLKVFGWSGKGQRTLESVGLEYEMTRERIRQIADKTVEKLTGRKYATPFLDKALDIVRTSCPARAEHLAELLKKSGVSKEKFDVTGLENACEHLGKSFDLVNVAIGNARIYVRPASSHSITGFFRLCRRLTSKQGCANFDAVCDELEISPDNRSYFRDFVTIGGCEWLDDGRHWLFAPRVTRNRLANLVKKVFGACSKLSLGELRRAVGRSRRLAIVPPTNVLGAFIERIGLATVSQNVVSAVSDFSDAIEPYSNESTMISILRKHGPVLSWDRFEGLCVEAGMNPVSFGIVLSTSPVIARLARGVYSLVGAHVPPGIVEETVNQIAERRREAEWGWTPSGTFWFGFQLTRPILTGGAVRVPAFVAGIAGGAWKLKLGGGKIDDTIKCNNSFLWGLRRSLASVGAEPDDICVLEFDVTQRTLDLTVGGEELIDGFVHPKIRHLTGELPGDVEEEIE